MKDLRRIQGGCGQHPVRRKMHQAELTAGPDSQQQARQAKARRASVCLGLWGPARWVFLCVASPCLQVLLAWGEG